VAGDAEHALPVRRAAPVARPERRSDVPDAAARPVSYEGTAAGDPTWDTLPLEVLQLVEREHLVEWPSIASFVAPAEIRTSKDGSHRRSILAWRLDQRDDLLLIEAAQSLDDPKARWRVRVATLSGVQVQHASMQPVPLPETDPLAPKGAGTRGAPSPDDYRGAVPEVWANLPRRVRDALDVAVPLDVCRTEEGAARLWYKHTGAGVAIVEKLWYGRHGRNHMFSAVFAERSAPSALSGIDADAMRQAVLPAPWTIVAFRATVEWRNARRLGGKKKALGRGGPKELNAGVQRRELEAGPRADGDDDGRRWNPFRRK